MPIYEYRCTACGHELEVIQKTGDRPPRKCSHCAGRMEKLISRAAFQLKGGGWYSEGYSKGGKSKEGKGAAQGCDGGSSTQGDGGSKD